MSKHITGVTGNGIPKTEIKITSIESGEIHTILAINAQEFADGVLVSQDGLGHFFEDDLFTFEIVTESDNETVHMTYEEYEAEMAARTAFMEKLASDVRAAIVDKYPMPAIMKQYEENGDNSVSENEELDFEEANLQVQQYNELFNSLEAVKEFNHLPKRVFDLKTPFGTEEMESELQRLLSLV